MNKRMSLVVSSGTADKLGTVASLVAGAAAMEIDVELLLTFWGLDAFRKGARERPPRLDAAYADDGVALIARMRARSAPHWLDTLRDARAIGSVRISACSASMELLGLTPGDLEDVVDEVTGVATFVDRAKDADIAMFV